MRALLRPWSAAGHLTLSFPSAPQSGTVRIIMLRIFRQMRVLGLERTLGRSCLLQCVEQRASGTFPNPLAGGRQTEKRRRRTFSGLPRTPAGLSARDEIVAGRAGQRRISHAARVPQAAAGPPRGSGVRTRTSYQGQNTQFPDEPETFGDGSVAQNDAARGRPPPRQATSFTGRVPRLFSPRPRNNLRDREFTVIYLNVPELLRSAAGPSLRPR